MQLGPLELVILLAIILLLFGGGRIVKIMREVGEGSRKLREGMGQNPEPNVDPAAAISTGGGAAVLGSIFVQQGDFIGRDQINVTNYADLSPFTQKPLAVFVSSAEQHTLEREAVQDTMLTLGKLRIFPTLLDLHISTQRSPELTQAGLAACNLFWLFASGEIGEEQIAEYHLAQEKKLDLICVFAPQDQAEKVSQQLGTSPEKVIPYANSEHLKRILHRNVIKFMFDSFPKDNSYHLTRADLSVLIGLAGGADLDAHWLKEAQDWLERIPEISSELPAKQPADQAAPAPVEKPPSKKRSPAPPAGYIPETVPVPAGYFWMGSQDSDTDAYENEKPYHEVYLDAYRIGKYPVTVAQFRVFVDQTGHLTDPEESCYEHTWRTPHGEGSDLRGKDQHPVTQVSWNDAKAYCDWLSRITNQRWGLPTEAQWERAARGVDGRKYPWGNAAPDKSRCNTNLWFYDTTPVGQFSPLGDSPCGCADMAGNVWEWCADWYDGEYYQKLTSRTRTPLGPAEGISRVVRGGSHDYKERNARCSYRFSYHPYNWDDDFGFRVAVLPSSTLNSERQ